MYTVRSLSSGVFARAGVEHRLMEATLTVFPLLRTELSHPCILSSYTPGYYSINFNYSPYKQYVMCCK